MKVDYKLTLLFLFRSPTQLVMSAQGKKTAAVKGGVNRSGLMKTGEGGTTNAVLTNWDDMIACGMPEASVKDAYQRDFGETPDSVHINDEFCKHYGWLSYNRMSDIKYYNVTITPATDISGERILENDTLAPIKHTVKIETTVVNSATVTVKSTSKVSTSSTIAVEAAELGLGAPFLGSFTFSNEVGSSSTQSINVKISETVEVTVPPMTKARVYLRITWEERKEDFEIPVEIDPSGLTGAEFRHTVKGHYHWAVSHAYYFTPPFESSLRGSLKASYNTTGSIIVERVDTM